LPDPSDVRHRGDRVAIFRDQVVDLLQHAFQRGELLNGVVERLREILLVIALFLDLQRVVFRVEHHASELGLREPRRHDQDAD
jgi:hypothetical protein